MEIKIRNYRTNANLVVATANGHRRFTADTFKQAKSLAIKGKDLLVLSFEPSFNPPWKPIGRFMCGQQVPIVGTSQQESSAQEPMTC